MRFVPCLALAFLALSACDHKKTTPAPVDTASAAATNVAPPTPPPANSAVMAASGNMSHCPSALDGVSTLISDVEGGVQVVVTANSDPLTKEIRARSKTILDASKTQATTVHHTGTGGGGGSFGRCPIVMRNTLIDVSDTDGGSKITVKPATVAELDWLRRETRERQANLAAPTARGAGRGKMNNCPSAVDGAATKLADTKDGVQVTVVAKGADAAQAIRDRVKHLVEVASETSPDEGRHTGKGQGGGAIGRCPIVLKNTSLEAKDIEGGSVVTVKAKKAADADALRKEARDRAENFGSTKSAK